MHFGKHPNNVDHKRKFNPEELNWTKKSIFFELVIIEIKTQSRCNAYREIYVTM